jgi:hypothetical protein
MIYLITVTDNEFVAILNHQPKLYGQLELKIGDILLANKNQGYLYNGYGSAQNNRTGRKGLL